LTSAFGGTGVQNAGCGSVGGDDGGDGDGARVDGYHDSREGDHGLLLVRLLHRAILVYIPTCAEMVCGTRCASALHSLLLSILELDSLEYFCSNLRDLHLSLLGKSLYVEDDGRFRCSADRYGCCAGSCNGVYGRIQWEGDWTTVACPDYASVLSAARLHHAPWIGGHLSLGSAGHSKHATIWKTMGVRNNSSNRCCLLFVGDGADE